MNEVSVSVLKNKLSYYLAKVKEGETFLVKSHNEVVGILQPVKAKGKNRTILGCGIGTMTISEGVDLTDPVLTEEEWGDLYPKE